MTFNEHLWKMNGADWQEHLRQFQDTDLAWAAGFFDGEGCIGIRHKKRPANKAAWFVLEVCIVNTNEAALRRIKSIFFGTVHKRKKVEGRQQIFSWQSTSKAAERFLQAIEQYSLVKNKRIRLALEFRGLGQKKPYQQISMTHYRRAAELAEEIRQLNGRNYQKGNHVVVPKDYVDVTGTLEV